MRDIAGYMLTTTHTCCLMPTKSHTPFFIAFCVQIPFDMRDIAGYMLTILTSLESEAFAISKAHSKKKATDDQLELSKVLLEVAQVRVYVYKRKSDHFCVLLYLTKWSR